MTISLNAYAKHRGCRLFAVQQAIKAGRLRESLTPEGKIRDANAADSEWEATTHADRRPLSGPASEGDGESLAEARTRLETAKAALAEMDLAERRAELLPAANVERRLVTLFGGCRTKLLGVPAAVRQRDPSLTKEQLDMIEDAIREALEDLACGGADGTDEVDGADDETVDA